MRCKRKKSAVEIFLVYNNKYISDYYVSIIDIYFNTLIPRSARQSFSYYTTAVAVAYVINYIIIINQFRFLH